VKIHRIVLTSLALLAAMPVVLPAQAQTRTTASTVMTDGVIRKVDKGNKTLTIRHGDIANLNMGAMTMVFEVKKAALLDKLQAGDKVRFHAEQEGDKLIVTEISAVK
jgi:Cu/Ag efflux protein CusF